MALYHFDTKLLSRSTRNTVRAIAYRAGCELRDLRTGEIFNYENKPVQHVELVLPKDAPEWAINIQKLIAVDRQSGVQALVDIAESAEKRIDARVWREFEFALHRELTDEQNMALAREFVQDQLCGRGMVAQLNFHFDVDEVTGEAKPHCHVTALTRCLTEKGLSSQKETTWDKKIMLLELREQWAHYSNFHLKLHGHDVQIDHRSYYERGIDIEPQPKRGKSIIEQERKAQILGISPVTDKQKAFEEVKLRNLYRIISRPEVVLDIVTKHHTTFMWADVQKVLHRYIDEIPLFQKMEARLKNSSELIVLHSGKKGDGKESPLRDKDLGEDISNKAIFTTKSMLKAETSLVEAAENLGRSPSHWIEKNHIERSMVRAYQRLGIMGGLSREQEKAIQHLVGMGQLKCVVGIAGSGKTTILSVCHEVWESAGHRVYGLAPTGKAAQNLEQSGIQSTTVHKFLKEFESGRCQYNSRSVLVLDEAGMVDVERFSELLSAVQQLKVKLVVVGDGAQLQPVEAGPAFRLITERIGKKELTTVVRQKEEWQKEATILFGKQKTEEALQQYMDKGHVHIVEEKLPSLEEVLANKDYEGLVKLYEVSNRASSLIYREMLKDVRKADTYTPVQDHQDFDSYLKWKELEKEAAKHILEGSESCKPILEARSLDPTRMALLSINKNQPLPEQQQKAHELLKEKDLDHLIGIERPKGQSVEVRQQAKEALLSVWHSSYKEAPDKTSLMLAFTNQDVNDLNKQARFLLKQSCHLDKQEFAYTIKRETEDDFGKKRTVSEEKAFSKGDRIVFTRNNYGLGVKNGTMGTIIELNKQKIHIRLDDGLPSKATAQETQPEETKEISFAPKLNPFFDYGWAVTIHKSQGTTVDKSYVLASSEMNQNLAYVAMTRHREDVQVFGSSLDFWQNEKFPQMLSKSGEKLSAADYLDAQSLEELLKKEDKLLTRIFNRLSDELEAIGSVSKKAFWQVADHFLGIQREAEIRINPETFSRASLREEARAELILQNKQIPELLHSDPEKNLNKDSIKSLFQESSPITEKDSRKSFLRTFGEILFKNYSNHKNVSNKSFDEIVKLCEDRLHKVMKKEEGYLTMEQKERLPLQAEKTATFLMHSHYQKGLTPTEKEISDASLRAKYELKRIPEIREGILQDWQKNASFGADLTKPKENEAILAYMVAERLASIEGRLYLEAKQQGLPTPPNLRELAQKELKQHRAQTKSLAQEISQKYSLADTVATSCAKDILRYKETHGKLPSAEQTAKILRISHELEKKSYAHPSKELDQHEIDFLRRKEGDLLFRHLSGRNFDSKHLPALDTFSLIREMESYNHTVSLSSRSLVKSPPALTEPSLSPQPNPELTHEKQHDHSPSL